jgi:hypothetical protein
MRLLDFLGFAAYHPLMFDIDFSFFLFRFSSPSSFAGIESFDRDPGFLCVYGDKDASVLYSTPSRSPNYFVYQPAYSVFIKKRLTLRYVNEKSA